MRIEDALITAESQYEDEGIDNNLIFNSFFEAIKPYEVIIPPCCLDGKTKAFDIEGGFIEGSVVVYIDGHELDTKYFVEVAEVVIVLKVPPKHVTLEFHYCINVSRAMRCMN